MLDIGAGTGILGYMACDAGASRVLAIERSGIIELARDVAIVNGLAERITHYQCSSLDVEIAEKADVAIFSMLARFGADRPLERRTVGVFLWRGADRRSEYVGVDPCARRGADRCTDLRCSAALRLHRLSRPPVRGVLPGRAIGKRPCDPRLE